MEHGRAVDRPPGRFLRWIAERVASRSTCERVLLPLLADLHFEHSTARGPWARGLIRAGGVLAFWRALSLTSTLDVGNHLRVNAWATTPEEARATRELVARIGLTCATCTLAFAINDWSFLKRFSADLWALLIPAIAMVVIPFGLLLGFAFSGTDRLMGQTKGARNVAILAALVTFAIGAWLTPVANQAHREGVWRAMAPEFTGPLARGERELSFDELAARSTELRSAGREKEAERFQLEWHKKPALGAACLAFALAGAAIASTLRRWFWRLGAALVVAGLSFAMLRVCGQAADAGRLASAVAMWGPFLGLAAIALVVLRLSPRRATGAATR